MTKISLAEYFFTPVTVAMETGSFLFCHLSAQNGKKKEGFLVIFTIKKHTYTIKKEFIC